MRKTFVSVLTGAAALAISVGLAQAQDIRVATVGPMTGPYASFGEQMKRGAEMAVADINAAGGVMGRKLVLQVEDDACDAKQAVAAANKLAAAKTTFVAGHFCSGSSIPASDVYKEENILQMSPASTNPKLTEQGKANVFRVCGRDDQQGAVAGELLATRFKGKKIAIIHDKTAYGQGLAEETQKGLGKQGGKEALFEAYTPGEKDYSALVSKLKAEAIDVIYVGGYHTEAALIIRQAHEKGYKPQIISGDALVTDDYWKFSGPAGQGTMMTFPPDPRKDPKNKDLVAKFKAINYDPEGYTLYTYAAIQTYAQAVAQAGGTDMQKVVGVLRAGKFNTVLGTLGFDAKGDVNAPGYVWYQWQDGKYDYAKTM